MQAAHPVLLLDDDEVVTGGWGVPAQWDTAVAALPGGYDRALISAVTGHENSVPPDTLCVMAAAVRPGRQGSGLAGKRSPRSASEPPRPDCNG